LPLQGRHSFGIMLGAIAGETPVAVEAGRAGFQVAACLKNSAASEKLRGFRAHDAEVVVRAGEDLGKERAILLCSLRFPLLAEPWEASRQRGIRRQASLYHRFRSLVFVRRAGLKSPAMRSARTTVAALGAGLFVEYVLGIVF